LRVLAQPLQDAWRVGGKDLRPRGRLLVLSTQPARDISPWLRECESLVIDDAAQGSPKPETPADAFEDLLTDTHTDVGMALRFIPASVNGLRRDTLRRCIEQWWHLFRDSDWPGDAHFREIEVALEQCKKCIVEVPDVDVEAIGTRAASDELEREPVSTGGV